MTDTEPDGSYAHPFYCENAECGNELTFDDIQAQDGLCGYCADRPDDEDASS